MVLGAHHVDVPRAGAVTADFVDGAVAPRQDDASTSFAALVYVDGLSMERNGGAREAMRSLQRKAVADNQAVLGSHRERLQRVGPQAYERVTRKAEIHASPQAVVVNRMRQARVAIEERESVADQDVEPTATGCSRTHRRLDHRATEKAAVRVELVRRESAFAPGHQACRPAPGERAT